MKKKPMSLKTADDGASLKTSRFAPLEFKTHLFLTWYIFICIDASIVFQSGCGSWELLTTQPDFIPVRTTSRPGLSLPWGGVYCLLSVPVCLPPGLPASNLHLPPTITFQPAAAPPPATSLINSPSELLVPPVQRLTFLSLERRTHVLVMWFDFSFFSFFF